MTHASSSPTAFAVGSTAKRRSRYFALLVVIALHCAVIAVLVVSSKTRRRLTASPAPIELLFYPPSPAAAAAAASTMPTETALPKLSRKPQSTSVAVPESAFAPNVGAPQQSTAPIDWAGEAQSVAAAIAAKPADPRLKDEAPLLPPKSIFPEAPAHHAGDEFTTVSGERAVFVSDSCYQVSRTQLPNASNTGMVNPTYCIGKSKTPRGDLFDQLPAYKKYHPN